MKKFIVISSLFVVFFVPTVHATTSAWDIKKNATSDLEFNWNNLGTSALTIKTDGKVGIGTTTPTSSLHIVGLGNTNPSLTYHSANAWSLETGAAELVGGILTTGPWTYWLQTRASGSSALPLSLNPLGGNVGIGTTSPTSLLELRSAVTTEDSSPTTMLTLTKDDVTTSDGSGDRIKFRAHDKDSNIFDIGYIDTILMDPDYNGIGRSGNIVFSTLDNWTGSNSPLERMRIDGKGNVGIGTTSPGSKLDVYSDIRSTGPGSSWGGTYLGLFTGLGSLPSYPNNTYATIKTDGTNIGFSASGLYSAYMTDNGTWCRPQIGDCFSDIRLKENLQPLIQVTDKIKDLRTVYFNFRKDIENNQYVTKDRQIGLIAQDVEKVFPEITFTNDNGYKGIDYDRLSVINTAALKEMANQIDDLKQKNTDLEKRITVLENR